MRAFADILTGGAFGPEGATFAEKAALSSSAVKELAKHVTRVNHEGRPGEPRIRCPLSRLTLGAIKPEGKSPRLRMKAANTRYMIPIVRCVLENIFPPTSPREQLCLDCLIALDEFYKLLKI